MTWTVRTQKKTHTGYLGKVVGTYSTKDNALRKIRSIAAKKDLRLVKNGEGAMRVDYKLVQEYLEIEIMDAWMVMDV
jgi:hypothetical protein